jgi:hypothetical protein
MKRSPMAPRRTRVATSHPAARATAAKAVAAKRSAPRETGFSTATKALVRLRAGYRCEACAIWLGEHGGQVQHRVARGIGGSRRRNKPSNAALLCGTPQSGDHGRCEERDPHMNAAGFWLASWQDPKAEPIMLHDLSGGGMTVWLDDEGGYLTEPPIRDAA